MRTGTNLNQQYRETMDRMYSSTRMKRLGLGRVWIDCFIDPSTNVDLGILRRGCRGRTV